MTGETWQEKYDTSVYVDDRLVPLALYTNPWFWRGRRLGLRIAPWYYNVRLGVRLVPLYVAAARSVRDE